MFCHEFHLVDLRVFDNCAKVCEGADHVFNLAADMGGMGFIQSNHSVIMYNNTMISFNMLEAARRLQHVEGDHGVVVHDHGVVALDEAHAAHVRRQVEDVVCA